MANEKGVENSIKEWLTSIGAYWVKHFANQFTRTGVPDLLCCVNGRFVGIEVKDPDGEPTPLQLFNLKQIKKAGGVDILADNLKVVQDRLEKEGVWKPNKKN